MGRRPGGEAAIRARIEAAPGLQGPEGHKLAGFLEAEGHLAIVPNNRDGWRCACAVSLRDDDAEVLVDASRHLGLGHVSAVAARNTSRPQTKWAISSKLECRSLVQFLDAHPLRGRKLREYEIWREAVALWGARAYGLDPAVRARLDFLARALRTARAYREPHPDTALPALNDEPAGHYLAGFFSGEGSFGLAGRNARFLIKLRRDDRPLLDAFRRDFRLGSVSDVDIPEPASPAAVWHVTAGGDVLRGIAIFEATGLLGRKQRQFRAWRPGAEAVGRAKFAGLPLDVDLVERARRDLRRATAYSPTTLPLRKADAQSAAREAYLDVLKTWAAFAHGPLTSTAYEEVRRRVRANWPKRDTIATTFGGWSEAIGAAGLAESR